MPAEEEKEEKRLLPKRERVVKGSEIRRILQNKQYQCNTPLLRLVAKENKHDFSRWAIICPGNIGKAVARNKLRRRTDNILYKNRHKYKKKADFVLIMKKIDKIKEIENSIDSAIRKISL